jgi:hypothetical protein
MSRIYKAGHSLMRSFTVTDDTGAAANADATPIGAALRNGVTDGAVAVTVAAHSTGVYHASFTIPGTYAAGDVVELVVTAAVGGVTTKAVVDSVRLVAFDPTDADALGVGNLDTNVGSRLAYADYTAPDNAGIGALGDAVDALQPGRRRRRRTHGGPGSLAFAQPGGLRLDRGNGHHLRHGRRHRALGGERHHAGGPAHRVHRSDHMTARLWIGVGGAGSADAPSLPSGRRCEDFGHRDLADGLPEGFSSDAADPLASHAVVEKVGSLSGRVLRTLNDRDALGTFVSWDALDGQTDVEVYVRASWTHVGDPTSHGTRALAVFTNRNEAAPREYRLGVNIDGAEAFKWDPSYDLALGRRQMLLSGDGRYDSLMVEPLNVLLRVVGGRVRGSMWTDDAPWNTWLWDFFDPSPSPLAGGQVGWMAGLFNETLDVEFISAGVGGADAPMPGVSAGFAPWRPDVSVALADGVATFTGSDFTDPAGRTHASSRWRVYALPVDDDSRYRVSAPQLVHDSDWQAEDLQTRILTGLSMGSEYGVTVEYRNQDGVTSAPAMLTWFHLGASLARSGHQDGYDLLGTVSPDCNSVPADETVTVAGMPPGFSVLREHADGQLTPYSFLGGARFPTPMVAGLDGSVTFTVPEADGSPVVALRLFGRTRRKSGDAPTAVLDV